MRSAILAAGASVLLLAGCATATPMPAPMSQAEAQQRVDDGNRAWWDSMFPGEQMPTIEAIDHLDLDAAKAQQVECLRDAGLEGLTINDDGSWSSTMTSTPERSHALNLALFVCALQHPVDLSEPGKLGMLTDEEMDWIWQYNQQRLMPCLEQLGYAVAGEEGADIDDARGYWFPYFELSPVPTSEREWALIDLHCPPSPIGPEFRPMAG